MRMVIRRMPARKLHTINIPTFASDLTDCTLEERTNADSNRHDLKQKYRITILH